jgi:hypothetical protein
LDSAALVKLVRSEACSTELLTWLNTRADTPLVSSALVEVELPRALRRHTPELLTAVESVLDRLYLVDIDRPTRKLAADFSDTSLRSLDAIHLATAQMLANESHGQLACLVTYDRRLLSAGDDIGLKTESPGQVR